jgi:hypothetical protein
MVLRLRGAEKSKKSSKVSRVTLLLMESGFFCAVQKVARKQPHAPQPVIPHEAAQPRRCGTHFSADAEFDWSNVWGMS